MKPPRRPDWLCVHEHALDHLPRVLAGMGFTRIIGPLPWAGTPLYDRGALLRHRPLSRAYAERDRAVIAERNLARAYSQVRVALAPQRAIYVCETRGNWSDETGGARGDLLPELGALMWGCRFGQAAFRIARLCGLEALPHA